MLITPSCLWLQEQQQWLSAVYQDLILQAAHRRKHLPENTPQTTGEQPHKQQILKSMFLFYSANTWGLGESCPWIRQGQPRVWAFLSRTLSDFPALQKGVSLNSFPVHCAVPLQCLPGTATTDPTGPGGIARVKHPMFIPFFFILRNRWKEEEVERTASSSLPPCNYSKLCQVLGWHLTGLLQPSTNKAVLNLGHVWGQSCEWTLQFVTARS